MNYAITPRHILIKEIVASVEQSITNLPTDCKDELRADICSILKKAKTPATSNNTREEREAVKELKGDDRIIILPAVLNKPDYNEQVMAMLQDTKRTRPSLTGEEIQLQAPPQPSRKKLLHEPKKIGQHN